MNSRKKTSLDLIGASEATVWNKVQLCLKIAKTIPTFALLEIITPFFMKLL